MTREEWRPVVGYEGVYEVSSLGRMRNASGAILHLGPHTGGYRTVHLYLAGSRKSTTLHRTVCEAFHGPAPFPNAEVRHLDGVKSNCEANNLTWGTRLENEADKIAHGTQQIGEKHPGARLTKADVLEIRRRAGEPQQDLADEFGCTFSNISAIQRRKSWAHV